MQNRIIGVIAPKGSGKTYTVSRAVMSMDRVAIFDMVHERGYLIAEPITGKPRAFAEALRAESFRIVYRPVIFEMQEGDEYCPEFEPFVYLCYLRGDMVMVIDEAHLLCNAHTCPQSLLIANRIGRHRELSIIFITQSFSAVARPLTQNADEFLFWRIIEPSDLDGIRARCGSEVRDKVASLRGTTENEQGECIPGQMLHWSKTKGIITITQ